MGRKTSIAVFTVFLGLASPAAVASPIDVASDHAALSAYDRYLRSAASNLPAWRREDNAFVVSISAACPDVLASLGSAPDTVNQTALFNLGQEAEGDLGLVGVRADRDALAALTRAVSRLPWSSGQARATVGRFVATQRRLFGLAPSHLCDDARALAGLGGAQTPPGTTRWLNRFVRQGGAQEQAQLAFERLLRHLQTPADTALVLEIDRLDRRVGSRLGAISTVETEKLFSALGRPIQAS